MRTRRATGFALVFCLIAAAVSFSADVGAAESQQAAVDGFIAQGKNALKARKPDEAIAAFDSAIVQDAGNAVAFFHRASARMQKQDRDGALADLEMAISIDPAYAEAYRLRGNIMHVFKKDKDRALSDYDRAIELKPNDAQAYVLRGIFWVGQKDHGKAYQDFDRAILEDPKFVEAYLQRGQLYQFDRKIDLAFADFDAAVSADPTNARAHTRRGEIWLQRGSAVENFDRAIADFEEAVNASPNDPMAKQQLQATINLKEVLEKMKTEKK